MAVKYEVKKVVFGEPGEGGSGSGDGIEDNPLG